MGLTIQLYYRFGSKWMLNKLHLLGYMESYAETQDYKYCFFINRNGVGISVTIIEETNDLVDDEVQVHFQFSESEISSESPWRLIICTGSISAITQFVRDDIDLNIVFIYWNTSFHSIGLIKVTSPEPPSADDWRSAPIKREKLKALTKAKILKATEVKIVPFKTGKT